MAYIVACPDPELLAALRAFAELLATLPEPRDPRGMRHPLPVLLGTLLVALAGGADSMAAVAAFTHDHRAWFRLWLPLGDTAPSRDTYLRLVRRLDPETAMKAALWLLDGTSVPGLRELILALDGKFARRSGDRADGTRPLNMVSAFLVREGLTLAQEPCDRKSNEITAIPRLLDRIHPGGPWSRSTPPAARRPSCRPCGRPTPTTCWRSRATSGPCTGR